MIAFDIVRCNFVGRGGRMWGDLSQFRLGVICSNVSDKCDCGSGCDWVENVVLWVVDWLWCEMLRCGWWTGYGVKCSIVGG